ncbi:glycosyltransferase family 4 protein [Anaerosinus sp.]
MRVIIINDFAYINGGAGKIALATAKTLAEKNIEVIFFTGVGPIDNSLKLIKNLRTICLNQHDILTDESRLRAMIQGVWNKYALKKLREVLLELDTKDTIIHIHTCQKALSSSCVSIAIKMGFKVVYHVHDYGLVCPNLGFYNYKKQQVCNERALSFSCIVSNCDSRCYLHKFWRCIRQWVQNQWGLMPRKIENYIFVSNFSFFILERFLPQNSQKYFLDNPIDISPQECVAINKNDMIIFIGRLSKEKNPILLARATRDLNMSTVFIGAGDCEDKIKEINPKAVITGWLSKDEMEIYIKKARALVLPSSCYETQGLVVNEVAAYGIPSIVSDVSAAKDFVEDRENGLIFENNNLDSLKIKLQELFDDKFAENLGRNSYNKFYSKNFSINLYIEKLIKIYQEILEK